MSEENSSITSHLFVGMTTTAEAAQTPSGNVTSSSSSQGVGFYFQCAVVFIGVVGVAANALILYAMVVSKQHKKQLLIFNQNILDFCCCLLLVITFTVMLCNIRLTGMHGYWLCMMLLSAGPLWSLIHGSVINLMSITIERYIKVVYPSWANKLLRKWVIYLAIAFAWIAGAVYNMVLTFFTSAVIEGVCYATTVWNSKVAAVIHGIWNFVSFFVIALVIFTFCYWRILVVIRRQARVMAAHGSSQSQSNQIQTNVIKTMILVSAFYVITNLPVNIYYLLTNLKADIVSFDNISYATIFLSFFYMCANPFIYATKFDEVRRVLIGLIPCKNSQQPVAIVQMTGTS